MRPPIVSRLRPRPSRSTSTTTARPVELDRVRASGRAAPELGPVRLAAVAQLDLAPDVESACGRPRLAQPRNVARSIAGEQLAGVERGGDEGDVGEAGRQVAVRRREPVEPRRVDLAGAHLGAVEEVEQERLVRRPAPHDDRHLRQRPVQAGEGLVAVVAVGDDLGDHRVVLRRDDVALGDAGVDPDARPDRQREGLDRARRRREAPLRVLGVESGLDGVALRRRRLALEPAARGDVQLQLHEVETGRQLGDRVLDLQAGVDLEEGEAPARPAGTGTRRCRRSRSRRAGARRTAAARRSRSWSGVSAMQCDSSITFWLRRCMLQSRTPTAHTVPWWSAMIWTSTWRAPVTTRSMNTVGSPKALPPS